MAISATAEIHLEHFAILQHAIREGMVEGLTQAGELIVDRASQLAPRDTGALSESGESHITGTTLSVSFGNGLSDQRATAQEFGTIFMPAQPYLHPALQDIDVTQVIANAIKARLI